MAQLLNGRKLSKSIQQGLKAEIAPHVEAGVRPPGLAMVLVGGDPASQIYVGRKGKACERVGIRHWDHLMPESTSIDALLAKVGQLNDDNNVDGILVQLPLPSGLRAHEQRVIDAVSPDKDVDCFHPENVGRLHLGQPRFMPATPGGIVNLLKAGGVDVGGMEAVVVGRSNIVGKPMAALLMAHNATVTICHSRTADLKAHIARADVLVAAIGRAKMIHGSWLKPGAVVIDVGMNRDEAGLCGDVDFASAEAVASAITPVPGGVGPTTIATLLQNTVRAWRQRAFSV